MRAHVEADDSGRVCGAVVGEGISCPPATYRLQTPFGAEDEDDCGEYFCAPHMAMVNDLLLDFGIQVSGFAPHFAWMGHIPRT